MDGEKSGRQVYYKDKAAYNQALLDAIKDVRKQRVEDPARGFPNAVMALELLLFSKELAKIEAYKLDPEGHESDLAEATEKALATKDDALQAEIYLNEVQRVSWSLYRKELRKLLDEGRGPDVTMNGEFDKDDVKIMVYEALFKHIVKVLKEDGWLTWDDEDEYAGGPGGGLKGEDEEMT